jgi:PAS domain S-box-containing protein
MKASGSSQAESIKGQKITEIQPVNKKQSKKERDRFEAALQASEEKFRRLFETAQDGILLLDAATGTITEANPFLEKMLGYPRSELVGKKIWEIGPLKDVLTSQEAFRELQQKEYIRYESLPLETRDGQRCDVEFVSNVYLVAGQKIIQCNIRDITIRRQTEEEISLLAKFPSENPNLVMRLDREGRILYANAASQGLLDDWGCRLGDCAPQPWQEIACKALAERKNLSIVTSCGQQIIDMSVAPIVEADYVNLYGRDITELKLTEEEMKRKQVELERSNAELEQYAYIASHDLQEPLRMISSYLQLIERRYQGKLDRDADEFIAFAVDGATRMQELIEDLLEYSRVGRNAKHFQPVESEQALAQALANLEVAIQENKAEVTHDPLPTVVADDSQLTQLFQNLVGNGIKFHNDEEPRVHISVQSGPNEWVFSIHDNGIGIDPGYSERIFEMFQRLHSRSKYSGTGIGLAICKKIIERHGGRIWVESQLNNGSTFYFTIPIREGVQT